MFFPKLQNFLITFAAKIIQMIEIQKEAEFSALKREQWDDIDYGSWFKTKRGVLVDELERKALLKALQGKKYELLLDIGIATGRQAETYHTFINKLVGIDISSQQLEYAKKTAAKLNLPAEFLVCNDASKLDFPDQHFDAIICTRVLQHLYDWKAAIKDFNRVLKPNGDLYLITYNRFSIYGVAKWFQKTFVNSVKGKFRNPIDITRELKKNGFIIEHYAGAMIAQPSILPGSSIKFFTPALRMVESLNQTFPFKYFGERQVIRAKKIH